MTVLLCVVAYIIVTLINRKIYINLQKLDKNYYPNPAAICVYAMECKTTSFIDRLFKYTPKKDDDKKIKHNEEEDKRGWGGC